MPLIIGTEFRVIGSSYNFYNLNKFAIILNYYTVVVFVAIVDVSNDLHPPHVNIWDLIFNISALDGAYYLSRGYGCVTFGI